MPNLPKTDSPQPILILAERLDECCKRYRAELKRARADFAEEYVHDLRVAIRRLIAAIDMVQALLHEKKQKSRHLLKTYLDSFDELRDTQVQLVIVEEMQAEFPEIEAYRDHLRGHEKHQVSRLEKKIKAFRSGGLTQQIARLRTSLIGKDIPHPRDAVWAVVDDSYARLVRRRFAIRAEDSASIHRTRIAFKKFRYQMETIQPLLTGTPQDFLRNLHDYQAAMGEIQDAEVGLQMLDEFIVHKGKKLDAVRARLAEIHQARIVAFLAQLNQIETFWRPAPDKPFPWESASMPND